jgi:hypothetical protein
VISTTTLRQTVTPPELPGRAAAINVTTYGTRPIASVLAPLGIEARLLAAVARFLVQAISPTRPRQPNAAVPPGMTATVA